MKQQILRVVAEQEDAKKQNQAALKEGKRANSVERHKCGMKGENWLAEKEIG